MPDLYVMEPITLPVATTADGTRHDPLVTTNAVGKVIVTCTCTDSAGMPMRWGHPPGTRPDQVLSIYQSHLRYFDRPRTKVD